MMSIFEEQKERLLTETAKLHSRHELSEEMGPDYFEPGMMEYPEQSDGSWEEQSGKLVLRFEVKGTRYEGRTEQIEKVKVGDVIRVERDPENEFNHNNFFFLTEKGKNVGNMPAELCNAVAPLYDSGNLVIESASASFVDPISKRSRHAKQAVLFVEMHARLTSPETDSMIPSPDTADKASADMNSETPTPEKTDPADPYALQLDLKENSFFIGGYEICRDNALEDVKKQRFCENAKEVQAILDKNSMHILLRHTVEYAGEEWVVQLIFKDGEFRDLWLEQSKLFQQRSLLRNAASNPRMRKTRAALYTKLKKRLNDIVGFDGEQESNNGNLRYKYNFSNHEVMLVQDNNLPAIVIYVQYYALDAVE